MTSEPYKVSHSKVKLWLRCRQAYYYKYVERILKRKKSRPLHIGSVVHQMIEDHANNKDPFASLDDYIEKYGHVFEEEVEVYGDINTDVRNMMTAYFNYWPKKSIRYMEIDGKKAEHKFELEIDPDIVLTGFIDAIARTPNKLMWLGEHKTFKKLPNDDHRWRNLQSALYIRVIKMLGWAKDIDGVLWNYMRNTSATVPKQNKNGELSIAKINTLPSVALEAIKGYGLDPHDYQEYLEQIDFKQRDWFKRVYVPVNEEVIDKSFKDFLDTSRLMSDTHGQRSEMSIEQHCDWCDYEPLCRAQLTGGDVDYLKENTYVHKDKVKDLEKENSKKENSKKMATSKRKVKGKKKNRKKGTILKKKKLPTRKSL